MIPVVTSVRREEDTSMKQKKYSTAFTTIEGVLTSMMYNEVDGFILRRD